MSIKQSSVFSSSTSGTTEIAGVPLGTVKAIIQDIFPDITPKEVEETLKEGPISGIDAGVVYVATLDLPYDSKNFGIVRIINAVAYLAYEKTVSKHNRYFRDLVDGIQAINTVRNACQMDDREDGVMKGMGEVMAVVANHYASYMLHTLVTRYPKFKYQ